MERDPLDALDDELAEMNAPVSLLITEEDDGSLAVTDVAGDVIEDETAIALLLKGLIVMLAPAILQALDGLDEDEEEDDA